MLTVEDVWKSALPAGTQLTGGAEGLQRQVSWVARLLPHPPGFKALKGGEVALVSIQTMKQLDDRMLLIEIIRRLTSRDVAAVAVVGEISNDAIALADLLNFPLFSLPDMTDLHETEQEITRLVVERRTELYQSSQRIFMQLTELALDGQGVAAIVRKLAGITGKPLATSDENLMIDLFVPTRLQTLEESECRAVLDQYRGEILQWATTINLNQSDPPCGRFGRPEANLALLVVPIVSKARLWGFIILFARPTDVSEDERLTLSRAAAACAIGFARDRAVLEAQDRIHSSFVEDLLAGNFADAAAMNERGKRLGYTLSPAYAVLAFEVHGPRKAYGGHLALPHPGDFADRLARAAEKLWEDHLYKVDGASVVLLSPIETEPSSQDLKKTAENLRTSLSAALGTNPSIAIGIGRVYPGPEGVKTSYHEARQSIVMGSRVFGASCLTYFGDLGVYRLLFNLQGSDDLGAFYHETLGPLLDYDQKTNSDLIHTLQVYFANCGSVARAAEELQLHRNSLLYRLQRVKEISGLDLEDAEARLAVQLALHIGEILEDAALAS